MRKREPKLFDLKVNEDYLQQYYCTLAHLLKTADVEEKEFFAYIEAGCLPQHSYEWKEDLTLHSFLSTQQCSTKIIYYYHPRHLLLLHDLVILHRYMPLTEIAQSWSVDFKQHYLTKLEELDAFSDVLQSYDGTQIEAFLENEWQRYLQGIYGVCTRDPTPENIALQEVLLRRVRLITSEGSEETLSQGALSALKHDVNILDTLLASFAPYEYLQSPRRKWVDAVRVKHEL